LNLSADTIFYNGNVLTMVDNENNKEAIAIKNGKIIFVGDNQQIMEYKQKQTEMINLHGKTLMPGFIESHMHPTLYGTSLLEIDCRPDAAPSLVMILKKVEEGANKTKKGEWIRGWGWDDSKIPEKRYPTREELDKVAPDHPVFLKRTCAHMGVVNSKALEYSNITAETPQPKGGNIEKDENGNLTGLLQENALDLLEIPEYSMDELKEGMKLAQQDFARWGITTVHDMAVKRPEMKTYQSMLVKEEIDVRVRMWMWAISQMNWEGVMEEVLSLGIESGFGNDKLNVQGIKFMLDGTIGGKTAAVSSPYEGDTNENIGILYMDQKTINQYVKLSVESGLRVSIHAIGDRAIEMALTSIEQSGTSEKLSKMRHRIEHCVLPTVSHLERIKELNIIAASSVGFIYNIGDSYFSNLGPERMKKAFPHRSFKEYGIVAPGNSDLPITNGNPLLGVYGAVTRKTIGGQTVDNVQNISVRDALKAYTIDAAYSGFEEDLFGTIEINKYADLIVLSEDPESIPEDKIKDIKVELTMMNGRITFKQNRVSLV
jgi:predicted amidohydrolase YtcJ